jgi:hypothetical protein
MTDPGHNQMRVSDSDRQAAADRLRFAQSEGRLSVQEYDDRLGRLYQAVTYGDLASLFADLPNAMPPMPPPAFQSQPPFQQQPPYQQPYMPPPPPMTGPIAGPAAVVNNTIVVPPTPYFLPNSGYATAGLVLGILGLIGFWIPFGDIVMSGLAVILSVVGLGQTNSGRYAGRGKAIAGLVCGIIGLIPAILVIGGILAVVGASVH